MVQMLAKRRSRLGLTMETLAGLLILQEMGRQELD